MSLVQEGTRVTVDEVVGKNLRLAALLPSDAPQSLQPFIEAADSVLGVEIDQRLAWFVRKARAQLGQGIMPTLEELLERIEDVDVQVMSRATPLSRTRLIIFQAFDKAFDRVLKRSGKASPNGNHPPIGVRTIEEFDHFVNTSLRTSRPPHDGSETARRVDIFFSKEKAILEGLAQIPPELHEPLLLVHAYINSPCDTHGKRLEAVARAFGITLSEAQAWLNKIGKETYLLFATKLAKSRGEIQTPVGVVGKAETGGIVKPRHKHTQIEEPIVWKSGRRGRRGDSIDLSRQLQYWFEEKNKGRKDEEKLNRKKVAERMGLDPSMTQLWAKGRRQVPRGRVRDLAKALEITVGELLRGDPSK